MLNRQVEQSAPQVISYLMGWGDSFCSHRYVPVYWSALERAVKQVHPELNQRCETVEEALPVTIQINIYWRFVIVLRPKVY